MKIRKGFLLFFLLFLKVLVSYSQGNATARYEIDAKRTGVNPLDKDALPEAASLFG